MKWSQIIHIITLFMPNKSRRVKSDDMGYFGYKQFIMTRSTNKTVKLWLNSQKNNKISQIIHFITLFMPNKSRRVKSDDMCHLGYKQFIVTRSTNKTVKLWLNSQKNYKISQIIYLITLLMPNKLWRVKSDDVGQLEYKTIYSDKKYK